MLTLILLVVLGGGAGLAAVWLIDARGLSDLLGRSEGRSLRRRARADTTPDRPDDPQPATPDPATAPPPAARAESFLLEGSAPTGGAATVVAYEPVATTTEPPPPPSPSGRRDGRKIPAAYTAIEGSYRDVARVPLWRKVISLLTLLGILALIGVAIAALAGATFGAIAELVDSAVG